jgi:3-dehydroquinate synthase
MVTIQVKAPSKTYPVFLGISVINSLPEFITRNFDDVSKILIITDEKVSGLHLKTVKQIAERTGKTVSELILPEGEHAKTFEVFYDCHTFALAEKLNRKSLILALGGGAVGDVAGFVAATFMRGIPFIQIPTTLLAHDSAVGGKVAINHPEGKNMIGVFNHPEAVFYDLQFLRTLPFKELRSGFAEIVKEALVQDMDFYRWLTENIHDLQELQEQQFLHMIKRGIEIKAGIVEKDEKESGIRAYLNLGHTLGHALEAIMGYGKIPHGEAVMVGLIYALHLSIRKYGIDFEIDKFCSWIRQLGYETKLEGNIDKRKVLSLMKKDKKTVNELITFVLLKEIGLPATVELNDDEVLECLELMY